RRPGPASRPVPGEPPVRAAAYARERPRRAGPLRRPGGPDDERGGAPAPPTGPVVRVPCPASCSPLSSRHRGRTLAWSRTASGVVHLGTGRVLTHRRDAHRGSEWQCGDTSHRTVRDGNGRGITMGELIGLIIFGAVIGALARLFMKGEQPIGVLWTIILGVLGALAGYWLSGRHGGTDRE